MSQSVRKRSRRFRPITILACALVATAVLQGSDGPQEPPQGRPERRNLVDVLIGFQDRPGRAQTALVQHFGGTVTHRFHLVPAVAARVPGPAVAALLAAPGVTVIEPDGTLSLLDAELDAAWGVGRVGAGVVHAIGNLGTSVKVAIIDSGVDYTHPDLARNFAGGYDFVNDDTEPMDDNGHGTHVAGTLAAADDEAGVVGVAPEASFYALKAFDASGNGSFSDVIAALEWAVDHGAAVTNNSYGASQNPGSIVETAFANAERLGLVHVAAAGNTGKCNGGGNTVAYPARYDSVIAVAATDYYDARPCFSSSGPAVELAAPGASIYSTIPDRGYYWLSGTSMAAPHVAGVAALVVRGGVSDGNGNGRINDEVRATLIATSQDLGDAGRDNLFGFGLVDAAAAVGAVGPPGPVVVVDATLDKIAYVTGIDTGATLVATVTDEGGNPVWGLGAGAFALQVDGAAPAIVSPLAETAAGTYVATLDISALADGVHGVDVAVTDTRGLVGVEATAIVVVPESLFPADLTVSALSAPATAAAGTSFAVTDTTANVGEGPADASTTTLYLSADVTVDASDVVLGSRSVAALNSGGADAGSTTVALPPDLPGGRYWLIARANADGTIGESNTANNNRWVALSVGPDLVVAALNAPAGGAPGETLTVSDTTRNQGTGDAAASATRYYLSPNLVLDGGDVVVGMRAVEGLGPQAASTGSASVTVPSDTAPGVYYLFAKADGADAVQEAVETNNTAYALFKVGADLLVSTLSVPSVVAAGSTITVSDGTANFGAAPAGGSTTEFYLSSDVIHDTGDVRLASRIVPPLAAGAVSSGSTSVTIPAQTSPGQHYLLAVADARNQVAEIVETNNGAFRTFQIGPDLVIASLSAPLTASPGQTIAVSDTTLNQGTGTAGTSVTRFLLSADFSVDQGDVVLGERAVPALGPGQSSSQTNSLVVPAGTPAGSYQIIAVADANQDNVETTEINNTRFRSLQIGADLVVSTLSGPTTAAAGATIAVTDTTTNQGSGSAGASTTRFYLSTDFGLDANDVVLGGRDVPALSSGTGHTATTTVTIPSSTSSGNYYLLAQADAAQVVSETSESNNTRFWSVGIGADLVVAAVSAPWSAGAGTTITVGDTTKNQGTTSAGASTTRYFLSTNIGLDASDVVLGQRPVGALGAGATDAGSVPVAIPAGLATGTYFVIAVADADGAVVEVVEGNNTAFRSIQVGPDLTIPVASAPTSAVAGSSVVVTDTTTNAGAGTAGASTTAVYLSSDVFLDGGDPLIGSRPVPALGAGGADAGQTPVSIPAGLAPGQYYLIIKADALDAVQETQEANNHRLTIVQVTAGG